MNKIVIGLGFGDEGKGKVVNYLCSKTPNCLVVRFSGGHQVGHTVVKDGIRHIFSNFGSGTLSGVPTYWSKYCTVNPISLYNEYHVLISKGIQEPLLYIDERSPVTTPYDILSNQILESKNSHGSCGLGFGETINRELNLYSLTYGDLYYPEILKEKLKNIKNYYLNKFPIESKDYTAFSVIDLTEFLESVNYVIDKVAGKIENFDFLKNWYTNFIFEGSQGLMLDPSIGFYPNVTWSDLGLKNAIEIAGSDDFEIYLVTRAYQTRHGNGFMTNEEITHKISDNPLETNVENKYQGKFRKSLLDIQLLKYAINKEKNIKNSKKLNLVITCLDQIKEDDFRLTNIDRYNGNKEIITINNIWASKTRNFVYYVSHCLGVKNGYGSSSDGEGIKQYYKEI